MASTLPGDIIYLIVEILGQEKDFNSLFQCAVSAKCFTEHAVTTIYKFVYMLLVSFADLLTL